MARNIVRNLLVPLSGGPVQFVVNFRESETFQIRFPSVSSGILRIRQEGRKATRHRIQNSTGSLTLLAPNGRTRITFRPTADSEITIRAADKIRTRNP